MPTEAFTHSESQVSAPVARARKAPDWVRSAVFYQVYPQTFQDSDGDGIGDLPGIISRLPYLKSLGVDCIWLSPIYVSPFRDAGYDVADYKAVAPRYGTNADARALFARAHELGLRVILDFVPGHTSDQHPWFKESCRPTPNRHSNWYIWTNCTWFEGMGDYAKDFVQGACDRDGNYMTNFFVHQPALNYGWGEPDPAQPWQLAPDHPDVLALRAELVSILRFWLEMGCDGFRIDMAGSLVKRDKRGRIAEFWGEVRGMLDHDFPEAFIISEWSNPPAALAAGFHADFLHWIPEYNDLFQSERVRNPFGKGHSWFDREGRGDLGRFLALYEPMLRATRELGYISLPVGNHDLIRIRNAGRDERDLRVIHAFSFTMPNLPFLYYGDEIGMRQLEGVPPKEGAYCLRAGARTPMQWGGGPNLGFSDAAPDRLYFPVDPAPDAPTVAAQERDPESFLHFIRALAALRRNEPALAADAPYESLPLSAGEYPFVYLRGSPEAGRILVALNPADRAVSKTLPTELAKLDWQPIFGGIAKIQDGNLHLGPRDFALFREQKHHA